MQVEKMKEAITEVLSKRIFPHQEEQLSGREKNTKGDGTPRDPLPNRTRNNSDRNPPGESTWTHGENIPKFRVHNLKP